VAATAATAAATASPLGGFAEPHPPAQPPPKGADTIDILAAIAALTAQQQQLIKGLHEIGMRVQNIEQLQRAPPHEISMLPPQQFFSAHEISMLPPQQFFSARVQEFDREYAARHELAALRLPPTAM